MPILDDMHLEADSRVAIKGSSMHAHPDRFFFNPQEYILSAVTDKVTIKPEGNDVGFQGHKKICRRPETVSRRQFFFSIKEIKSLPVDVPTVHVYPKQVILPGNTVTRMLVIGIVCIW